MRPYFKHDFAIQFCLRQVILRQVAITMNHLGWMVNWACAASTSVVFWILLIKRTRFQWARVATARLKNKWTCFLEFYWDSLFWLLSSSPSSSTLLKGNINTVYEWNLCADWFDCFPQKWNRIKRPPKEKFRMEDTDGYSAPCKESLSASNYSINNVDGFRIGVCLSRLFSRVRRLFLERGPYWIRDGLFWNGHGDQLNAMGLFGENHWPHTHLSNWSHNKLLPHPHHVALLATGSYPSPGNVFHRCRTVGSGSRRLGHSNQL